MKVIAMTLASLCHLRAGRTHGVAYAPARSDPDHHGGLRLGPDRRRTDRGSPPWGRGVVSTR
jgi:hypothetical protein